MPYDSRFSPEAIEHLDEFRKFEQQRIVDSIQFQLSHEPLVAEDVVQIRAIGVKKHNHVFIAGEEAELP